LSLFYTGDISCEDCAGRFSSRSSIQNLYDENGELNEEIEVRYGVVINLIQDRPDLIQGAGDLQLPADPTYTSCRLTDSGLKLACDFIDEFPQKPEFANWPDRRKHPDGIDSAKD
jgi:hypothetical protein